MSLSDLRQRTNLSIHKLSDRDTLLLAVGELESIARNLTHDTFATFLNCFDSAHEEPRVKRQCMRVLTFLSDVHGKFLTPVHVAKMVSFVVRCFRDSDSALRVACVECLSSMASKITKTPFSTFLNPLLDAVLHEQDHNSQTGSALCLAAAIDAAPDPEPAQLQKLLPKLLKLVTKDCFKAKAALLSLIGSVASAGGAANRNLLSGLVSCLLDFLSSKDWAARKAAGEAMSKLAVAERGNLTEFRGACLASLENRRFDKVKIVRDTLNHTLKLWKEVPETVLPQSQSRLSSKDDDIVTRSPPLSRSSSIETTQPKKSYSASRSPSSNNLVATSTSKKGTSMICDKKPNVTSFTKRDHKDCEAVCEDGHKTRNRDMGTKTTDERISILKLETRRALFRRKFSEKVHKSESRVVPFYDDDKRDVDVNQKEVDDLNVIRKQLLQIENQQSNLLELLQRFMGSSQSGMNQLENRVNGLEKSLDEISQNLEVSTGRISNTESVDNSCCRLPGAEFLSPKFWKRAESHYSYSTLVTRANAEIQRMNRPLQNNQVNMQGKLEQSSSENVTTGLDGETLQPSNSGGVHKILLANPVASANRNFRSSAQVGS